MAKKKRKKKETKETETVSEVSNPEKEEVFRNPEPEREPSPAIEIANSFIPLGLNRGDFSGGKAKGAVIHYTGGGSHVGTIEALKAKRLGYHFIIDRKGDIIQCCEIGKRLAHCGHSCWDGDKPNDEYLGISICSYGLVRKVGQEFRAWPNQWRTKLNTEIHQIRLGTCLRNKRPQYWEAATTLQQIRLYELCQWLRKNLGLDPFKFAGHDEVSLAGKIDPGGVLSFSMDDLRNWLEVNKPGTEVIDEVMGED